MFGMKYVYLYFHPLFGFIIIHERFVRLYVYVFRVMFCVYIQPNAAFKDDGKDGDYYVEFYYTVASAIKEKFPDIEIAGPVTWCPPIHWGMF